MKRQNMKRQDSNYPYYQEKNFSTTKELLNFCAKEYDDKVAYMFKRENRVCSVTYTQFFNEINALGTALLSEGMADRHVAVFGDNSYEWISVYHAVMASNAVLVPVDRELPPEGLTHVMNDGDVSFVFVGSNYFEKLKGILDKLPRVEKVFILDDKPVDGYSSVNQLKARGAELMSNGDRSYIDLRIDPEALTSILFTSGTTGVSKGVMLSQRNICADFSNALKNMHIHSNYLSVLPYHHAYESSMQICYLVKGHTICINESLRMFVSNMKLYKPYDILVVPLFVETIYNRIWAQAEEGGKDKMLRKLIAVSKKLRSAGLDVRRKLFKSIYSNFGGNLTRFICGGAPLKPYIAEFFDDIGIEVLTGYGITECSPLVCVNRDYFYDSYSCGIVIPECEMKIKSPDENGEGEILVRGKNVMMGYYKNPEATKEAFDGDWFLTGDIGRIDDKGRLFITGRKKNIIVLKNGKNIYPEEMEYYFAESPNIAEIIVSAVKDSEDNEAYLQAEIFPKPEVTEKIGREQVEKLIREEVNTVNDKLPNYKHIKKVTFRTEEFEKTTTKKIVRKY